MARNAENFVKKRDVVGLCYCDLVFAVSDEDFEYDGACFE